MDAALHIKVEQVMNTYGRWKEIRNVLDLFFTRFAPDAMWDESVQALGRKHREMERLKPAQMLKYDLSSFAPHQLFVEELALYPESAVFLNVWSDVIARCEEQWSSVSGLLYQLLDPLDMCLWLETTKNETTKNKTAQKRRTVYKL